MADRDAPAGRWLRAVRRTRRLSQRELAALAGVPVSTVSAIESGRRTPGLAVFERILTAAGFELAVVDSSDPDSDVPVPVPAARAPTKQVLLMQLPSMRASARLRPDDEHDAIRDRGGRRFPAHLCWGGKPHYLDEMFWWGWHCIAWYFENDPAIIPDHVYWHRPRPSRLNRPPRQHPFWTG